MNQFAVNSGQLFLNSFFFFLKYFTVIIGAISKTTSVLKLSQDPSAKNIKCQIKIKIKIVFSFKVMHFQKNKHTTSFKAVLHSRAIT